MGRWKPWRQSPWCPSPEDCGFLVDAVAPGLGRGERSTLLVLGTTPELLQLDWPGDPSLVAIDSSADMIAIDWQPHPRLPSAMVEACWQRMPLGDASVDAAVGDASLNALPGFDAYDAVLEGVARVLKPGGMLAVRAFLRDERPETCADVIAAAGRGAFANGVPFRLAFAMAAAGADGTLEFADLPARFDALVPDRDRFAEAAGWSREDLDRIDIYAGNRNRINFPTEAELRRLVAPRFELAALRYPAGYALADRCPTAMLVRH